MIRLQSMRHGNFSRFGITKTPYRHANTETVRHVEPEHNPEIIKQKFKQARDNEQPFYPEQIIFI